MMVFSQRPIAIAMRGVVFLAASFLLNSNGAAGENLAVEARISPARSLDVKPYSTANLTDGKITGNKDIQVCESCWCGGSTDLRYEPLDLVVDFGSARVVDRIVVTTCRLKKQQRLTDFDVFGWAETDWDGRPLGRIRSSKQLRMELCFEPVATSKLCIRLLGNTRPQHNFPHISELEVYACDGPAQRTLRPGGLPKTISELKTIEELETERSRLGSLPETDRLPHLVRRLELVEDKLAFHRKTQSWLDRLDSVDRRTKELIQVGVPRWAAAQSEALSKYVLWIHWWIDHQRPDGGFGGGWNDDVELVCGWPLACLAADDRRTFDSLGLLADAVWSWGPIEKHGYSTYTDVEHSAEEISYSQPRMVLLDYENPKWAERCSRTTQTCLQEFMGENGRGMLQFRSDWFGYKGDEPVVRADHPFDVPEGAKALKPALYAAWQGDEQARQIVLRYGDTWLDAAMQEYDGKPRGLLPGRIDFRTGKPQGIALRMPPMRATHYHLIGCYLLTGDSKYLAPAEATIRYFLVDHGQGDLPLMKSGDVEHMGLGDQLAVIASLWRRLGQDDKFDAHFERWSRRLADAMGPQYESYALVDTASPELWVKKPLAVGAFRLGRRAIGSQFYIGWLGSGDKSLLEAGCYNLSRDLSDLWGPLTWWFYDRTETRVTSNDHSAHSIQTASTMLTLVYTGGCGPIEAKYPYTPVSWEGTTPRFAALVLESDTEHVKLLACNLEPADRQVTMRLYELQPGKYRVVQGPDADSDDEMDEITESTEVTIERRTGVRLTLPSRKMQVVCVDKP